MLLYNIHILSYTSIINAHTHNTYTYTHTHKQGSSAGKIGPVVGKVLQDVRLEEGVYDNIVSLGGGAFKGTLQATWKKKNAQRGGVRRALEALLDEWQPEDLTPHWCAARIENNFDKVAGDGNLCRVSMTTT